MDVDDVSVLFDVTGEILISCLTDNVFSIVFWLRNKLDDR